MDSGSTPDRSTQRKESTMDVRVHSGEAQITLDLRDLEDILIDLEYAASCDEGLEPRTQDFIEALREKGIYC